MTRVSPYAEENQTLWDNFNAEARNGHFLFDRKFMQYHADRFEDASYIVFNEAEPVALLPGNVLGDTLYSHQGLTFGGLILGPRATSVRVLEVFDGLIAELKRRGVQRLVYKPLPLIYHRSPAQEDLYALFRFDARLIRRDITTTISYEFPGARSKRRQRGVRKSIKAEITFGESSDWSDFWDVLSDALDLRHQVAPTHTVEEMIKLAEMFPKEIRLHTALSRGRIVAGVVMFVSATVAHAQYIAASEEGRDVGALDGLFDYLIEKYRATHSFFDFGISNEDNGRILNEGLVRQKEEFGGSAVVHDVYEVRL